MGRQHNGRMETEKHEALGQRGEACIILVRRVTLANGQVETAYSLATGQRLRPTDVAGEFATLDGSRTFRLRAAAGAWPQHPPKDPAAGTLDDGA